MEQIDMIDNLWGSIIYNTKIDFFLHRIIFYIKLPYSDKTEYYELLFEKVYDFKFSNEYKDSPWNYIELTSIGIDKIKDGYSILMEIWLAEFEIKCESYNISLVYTEYRR